MRVFLISVFLVSWLVADAQKLTFPEFRRCINEAEYWKTMNKPDTAFQLYQYAFQNSEFEPLPVDVYNAALMSAHTNRQEDCLHLLRNVLEYQFEWTKYGIFTKDSTLFLNCLGEKYPYIRNFADSLYNHTSLDSLRNIQYQIANNYVERDQELVKNANADSLNNFHALFLSGIKKNGYPGYKKSGTDMISIIFLHILEPNYNYGLSLMKEAVLAGEATPYEMAAMLDYFECKKGNYQGAYKCHACVKTDGTDDTFYIENRLDIGVSIFFQTPIKTPWKPQKLFKWVNNPAFLDKYLIFDKLKK